MWWQKQCASWSLLVAWASCVGWRGRWPVELVPGEGGESVGRCRRGQMILGLSSFSESIRDFILSTVVSIKNWNLGREQMWWLFVYLFLLLLLWHYFETLHLLPCEEWDSWEQGRELIGSLVRSDCVYPMRSWWWPRPVRKGRSGLWFTYVWKYLSYSYRCQVISLKNDGSQRLEV